ncbi:tropomyosin alpha-3 chain-like [Trichosurus vulpecula]|uniref:tropomyosin alpha-3 chain-like n=1 Tax=Trichosurus vulpecula TaxID=9337 RepID=UPI00186ADB07|nr:tropomyosin alpha-3 chain-like [Trichosurus vulpecula]
MTLPGHESWNTTISKELKCKVTKRAMEGCTLAKSRMQEALVNDVDKKLGEGEVSGYARPEKEMRQRPFAGISPIVQGIVEHRGGGAAAAPNGGGGSWNWAGTMAHTDYELMKSKLHILRQQANDAEDRTASVRRELEAEKLAWEQAETEVASLSRRLQGVEEELDSAQELLETTLRRLGEAEKVASENERAMRVIEGRAMKDEEMMELQEMQLKEAVHMLAATEGKFSEMVQQLVIEGDSGRPEEQPARAEAPRPETDEQSGLTQQSPTGPSAAEEKTSQRKDLYEREIKILTDKFKVTQTRAELAESLTANMGKKIEDLEAKLKCSKEAHLRTQMMLARTLLNLNKV